MDQFLYYSDIFGTIVFAISGALAARSRKLDYFGGVVLATATAIGGGTLRDVLLNRTPVFWVMNSETLILIVISSVLTYFFFGKRNFPDVLLLYPDAFGLAVFATTGTIIAPEAGASFLASAVLGSMSAVCGGMTRDVLSGKVPVILYRDFYAVVAVMGAFCYLCLNSLELPQPVSIAVTISSTLLLRLLAIRYNWSLPFYTEMAEVEEHGE